MSQIPSEARKVSWDNIDDAEWSRALEKFTHASIDITHLDGTFPVTNNQAPPPPNIQEDSDDEVKFLEVKHADLRKNPPLLKRSSALKRHQFVGSTANQNAQPFTDFVDLTQSDEEPVDERHEMEVDEDSDIEILNPETLSMDRRSGSIMKDVRNAGSTSLARPTNEPSTSNAVMPPTFSRNPRLVPQMKKTWAEKPVTPTPAKRQCVNNVELVQNNRPLQRIFQTNHQNARFVGSSPRTDSVVSTAVNHSSSPKAGLVRLVQNFPKPSMRTVGMPETSENKVNVRSNLGLAPRSSSSKPAVQQQSSETKKDKKIVQGEAVANPSAIYRTDSVVLTPVNYPSSSRAGAVRPVHDSSKPSMGTALMPRESENKKNILSTLRLAPGSSSSKPAVQQQRPQAKKDTEPVQVRASASYSSIGATVPCGEETVQNNRTLQRTSQENHQRLRFVESARKFDPIVSTAVNSFTSRADLDRPDQLSANSSMRIDVIPKRSETKKNIFNTIGLAPESSSSKPAVQRQIPEAKKDKEPVQVQALANSATIGAALLGGDPSALDLAPGSSSSTPTVQRRSTRTKKDKVPDQVQAVANSAANGANVLGEEESARFFYFPRTHTVPTGLKRTPFNGELPKDVRRNCAYSKIMRKLKVQKDKNFPESTREGKIIESVLGKEEEEEVTGNYPDDGSKNDPKGVAVVEKFLGDKPDQDYMDLDGKEESLWSAEKFEEHLEKDEKKMEAFYEDIEDKYLFAVWRQFESQVPLEFALQNLQKNNYNIPAALGSISEYLKRLPQRMNAPSVAQVQYLATDFQENGESVDLSWVQDNAMRNLYMGEIHIYYYKFRKFFESKEENGGLELRVGCNCHQRMCRPLSFEPRFGCSNCTNQLRKHKLPADKLCLLCITQLQFNENVLPATNVTFDFDDLEKIKMWDEQEPKMSREEFEKWDQDQKNARYKKLQLTQEDVLMLNFEKLTIDNLAEQVTAQLQPYVLPHFSQCRCINNQPLANPPPEIPDL
ncbi:unnamed protein product [Caenorhabditis brenneri]